MKMDLESWITGTDNLAEILNAKLPPKNGNGFLLLSKNK